MHFTFGTILVGRKIIFVAGKLRIILGEKTKKKFSRKIANNSGGKKKIWRENNEKFGGKIKKKNIGRN